MGRRTLPRLSDDTPPPGLPAVEIVDLPLSDGDIARYEGTYLLRTGGGAVEARVHEEDRSLVARVRGGAVTRLLHQDDHEFVLEADPDSRVVFIVEGARARGLVLHQRGVVISGHRKP